MRIDGVDIEAVFGCVPANAVDNLAALEPLVGAEKAAAIVQAVTNYQDAKLLADVSSGLGEAMVGVNEQEIALLMAERGK